MVSLLLLLLTSFSTSLLHPHHNNRNPDKPSKPPTPPITQFTPDPQLRKAFYGVDYNPKNAMMPWCGATLQPVINDMILISQITNRVRLYGMDCNQADLTFQAINALGLNSTMQVVLTIWVDQNQTTYQRQHDTLFRVLDTYGTGMVNGISVGNEVLFRKDRTLTELGDLMKAVKAEIKSRYGASIPIFSSDVGGEMTASLAAVSDMLQGNIHPYFSGTPAAEAANWTMTEYANKITNNPTPLGMKGVISEVGWPSAPASAVYLKGSIPGLANMQTVVDTFVCQANAAGIPYYWFEFKDEPWKINPEVPVEPYWGIFDEFGKLKIKIPDCISP
ncbi:MAG: glycoside hydrolase family 17 protein [Linnemannia gamsii]|nr:MAG: glycoside hydrolase family 17 protein [Linnemannia gamsii]